MEKEDDLERAGEDIDNQIQKGLEADLCIGRRRRIF